MMNWLKKVDALAAKHGLKVVGIWTDPNMEAFEKFEQEPENLEKVTFNDIETRTVTVPSQTLAFLKNQKFLRKYLTSI
jgi:hypothetical protein